MRLYRRNKKWWLDVRFRGQRYVRTTHTTSQKRANQWARNFIAELESGSYRPQASTVTFERLMELARDFYRVNNRRSIKSLEFVVKRLAKSFAGVRVFDLTSERIERYKAMRLEEKAAKSTINSELSGLSLMFRLAVDHDLLARKPQMHFLDDSDNVRTGFVTQGDYLAIRAGLPERLADLTDFLWWTGLRLGTARQLQWRDVHGGIEQDKESDPSSREGSAPRFTAIRRRGARNGDLVHPGHLEDGTLRIRSETVKTKTAHEIPLVGEIAVLIERAAAYRTLLSPFVFHNNARPLLNNWCEIHWKRAATAVGLGHILIHDLRRSFVRNMRLAGMPEAVIMRFTGHRTRAIFDRYSIVSVEEQRTALEKMADYLGGQSKEPSIRKIR